MAVYLRICNFFHLLLKDNNIMKYVEIYKLQDDGTQKVVITCRLNDAGVALCEGEDQIKDNLIARGIDDYSGGDGSKLFPTDGLRFLEELSNNFRSGYLMASEIKE
jgi:hypothetical protein